MVRFQLHRSEVNINLTSLFHEITTFLGKTSLKFQSLTMDNFNVGTKTKRVNHEILEECCDLFSVKKLIKSEPCRINKYVNLSLILFSQIQHHCFKQFQVFVIIIS